MFLEPVVLSLVTAKLRGGRVRNLENVYIEGWYLFLISGLIQGFLAIGKKFDASWATVLLNRYFIYVIVLTYVLMLIAIILNLEKKYMKLLFVGLLLNLVVIISNEGKMPVSLNGFEGIRDGIRSDAQLPDRKFDIKHVAVDKNTKFVYLADIILIPKPYPLPKILSIGDVFLILGAFQFFQEETIEHKKKHMSQNTY